MSYAELPESVTALEEEVLGRWEEEDTFRESVARREGSPEFVFYEGPPTANGRPGVHHIISRTIKDLIARYRTMTGHHVTRIAGWDTHGLPVELEVEKELGISGKRQIEELGIAEFNRVCRENVFRYRDDWERLSRRIAYWLDYERAYITFSNDYIESAWWALSEIHRKGLLYSGYRIIPYCPRCGTGLSSHEVAQGYRNVSEPAVTVKFHLRGDPDEARVLSWTTTPWTLPGNLALAVGADIEYVRVRLGERDGESAEGGAIGAPGEILILARERLESVLDHPFEIVDRFPGSALEGRSYEPLFPGAVDAAGSDAAWTIQLADFVTVEDGTGVVHTAVMYGEDDFELGARLGLPMQHTVDTRGRFVDRVPGDLAQRHVKEKETEGAIRDWLLERDLLYLRETYEHNYPHCWRCESALLYMARDSWYIRTTAVKDRLTELNAGVDWHPPEIGRGRMGEWLENNVDWALSRDRYWGTPLPIWECASEDCPAREVLGSFDELAERVGPLPADFDPHRPAIDEFEWSCDEAGCDGRMRRVPQVADAWYDSGSMPFAQWHYPFENDEEFALHFPADYIAEGVDQTRGWFYSLLALSTILFEESPYRAVVVNDLILDAEGQKMSKSRGNVADPWEAIGEHGADVVRFYLLSSSNPWVPKRWDPDGLRETDRKFFATLRNTYRFFAMYARLEGWSPDPDGPARDWKERSILDRWLLGRLDKMSGHVRGALESYDPTLASRRVAEFAQDDLSNWYVRRSRDRFWATGPDAAERQDTLDAFATLDETLATLAALVAPIAPFHADWLFRALREGASVHLSDYPEDRGRLDPELDEQMEHVRRLAKLGRAAREELGVRVRQPLRTLSAIVPGGAQPAETLVEILRDELNIKRVVFLADSDEIIRLSVKPDFGRLGPRFGPRTPAVALGIGTLEPEDLRRLQGGEDVAFQVDGEAVTVGPADVIVLEEASGEMTVTTDGGYIVALDGSVDAELRAEGIARELVNRVQRLRRDAGLYVSDRIRLGIAGDDEIEAATREHREYISGETLAREWVPGAEVNDLEHAVAVEIEQGSATIGIERWTDR